MKNVEEVMLSGPPMFRVRMQGAPPPRGFAVMLVSGMEEVEDVKPGYWLSRYFADREGFLNFNFERELWFGFDKESDAERASEVLKQGADVETKIVKIGF